MNVRPADDGVLLHSYDIDRTVAGPARRLPIEDAQVRALAGLGRSTVRGLAANERVAGARIGLRPIPPDGLPMIGAQDDGYVVVSHSGATLAPLLGRFAAEEILGSVQQSLAPFRPGRRISHAIHDESFREMERRLAEHEPVA